jgi:hypothetical protein
MYDKLSLFQFFRFSTGFSAPLSKRFDKKFHEFGGVESVMMIGMIALGAIALFSMVMMIGTVLSKSPYGKFWAMLGGASVFMAAALLVLKAFSPPADAEAASAKALTPEQEQAAAQSVKPGDTLTIEPKNAQGQTDPIVQAAGNDKDLAFLGKVMDLLKDGKPLPKEYLALLPDGGQGILAAQAKSGTSATAISKPLQTQLVAIDRSNGNGQTRYSSSSYVPSKNSSSGSASGTAPATGGGSVPPSAPASGGNSNNSGGIGGATKPTPQPQPQPGNGSGSGGSQPPLPQPTPTPPKQDPPPPPPVSNTPSLLDGGLVKSLLGQSKDNMVQFFQYNQDLGATGSVHRYLRGDRIVEMTVDNDRVTRVMLRFQSFSPQGKDSAYYEDLMRQSAGLSKANASSRSGNDITYRNVYPGASNVLFHIDTAANYGYVQASQ